MNFIPSLCGSSITVRELHFVNHPSLSGPSSHRKDAAAKGKAVIGKVHRCALPRLTLWFLDPLYTDPARDRKVDDVHGTIWCEWYQKVCPALPLAAYGPKLQSVMFQILLSSPYACVEQDEMALVC